MVRKLFFAAKAVHHYAHGKWGVMKFSIRNLLRTLRVLGSSVLAGQCRTSWAHVPPVRCEKLYCPSLHSLFLLALSLVSFPISFLSLQRNNVFKNKFLLLRYSFLFHEPSLFLRLSASFLFLSLFSSLPSMFICIPLFSFPAFPPRPSSFPGNKGRVLYPPKSKISQ